MTKRSVTERGKGDDRSDRRVFQLAHKRYLNFRGLYFLYLKVAALTTAKISSCSYLNFSKTLRFIVPVG